jgi:hypothetical protein
MNRSAGKSRWMFVALLVVLIVTSVAFSLIYLTPETRQQGQPSPHALQQDE